jgi:N-acetylmuramoyl-L-alanine amidase
LNPDADDQLVYDVAVRTEGRLLALGASVFLTRGATNNPSEQERISFSNNRINRIVFLIHFCD